MNYISNKPQPVPRIGKNLLRRRTGKAELPLASSISSMNEEIMDRAIEREM